MGFSPLRSSSSVRSAPDLSGNPNLGALGRWLRKAALNAGTDAKDNTFVTDVTTNLGVTLGQLADSIMESPTVCHFEKVGIKSDGISRMYTLEQLPMNIDKIPTRQQPYKAMDKQAALKGKTTPLTPIFYRKAMIIAAAGIALGMSENDIFKLTGDGDYKKQRNNFSDDEVLTQYLARVQEYIAAHKEDPAMAAKCQQAQQFITAFSTYLTKMPQITLPPKVSVSQQHYDEAITDDQNLWKASVRFSNGTTQTARITAEIIETENTFRQSMAIVATKMAALPAEAITPAITQYLSLCQQLANNQHAMGAGTSKSAGELMQRGKDGHSDAVIERFVGAILDKSSYLHRDLQTMAACVQLYADVQQDIHRLIADKSMLAIYTQAAKGDGDTLDFESRLIQAIQRAPRYVLLARDLAKQLPDGALKASVLDAQLAIAANLDAANNAKAKSDDLADMNAAVEKLQHWGAASANNRKIVDDIVFMGVKNGSALDRHHYFENVLMPTFDAISAGLPDADKAALKSHIDELAKIAKISAKTDAKEQITGAKANIQAIADNPQKQAYIRELIIGYNATDQATSADRFNFLTRALQALDTHPTFSDVDKTTFRQAIEILLSHTRTLAELQGLSDELPSPKPAPAGITSTASSRAAAAEPLTSASPPPTPSASPVQPRPVSRRLTSRSIGPKDLRRSISEKPAEHSPPPSEAPAATPSDKTHDSTQHLVELPEGRGGYRRVRVDTLSSNLQPQQKPPKPSPLTTSAATANTDSDTANASPPTSQKPK